jgi:hypothetical protein
MKPAIFVVAALSGLAAFCGATEPAAQSLDERFPLLAQLSIPESALPLGCSIPEDPRSPIKGVKNRRVTTDPRAFFFIDREMTKRFGKHIEAAYFAVYEEGGELGVMGWAFATPAAAKDGHDRLAEKYQDRFRLWRTGKYVVCLWRDTGTTDTCHQAFAAFIQTKVDAFGTPCK